jgi:hypothetical protein
MSKENIKEDSDLSAAQCFFVEFQGSGVKPPITLLYYVFTISKVFGILSHFL